MTETPGPETISGAVPMNKRKIGLQKELVKEQTLLSTRWNHGWIAMLPYCISCKVPLVWHTYPGEDGVLFHCPTCKRQWVKGKGWTAKK